MTRTSSGLRPLPPTNKITSTRVEQILGIVLGLRIDFFWSSSAVLNLMASITISLAVGDRCTSSSRSTWSMRVFVGSKGSRTCWSNFAKWMPRSFRSYSVHLTRLSNTYKGSLSILFREHRLRVSGKFVQV